MWQNIAVGVIGILVLVYAGIRIYRLFTRPKPEGPCAGCPGCANKQREKRR